MFKLAVVRPPLGPVFESGVVFLEKAIRLLVLAVGTYQFVDVLSFWHRLASLVASKPVGQLLSIGVVDACGDAAFGR